MKLACSVCGRIGDKPPVPEKGFAVSVWDDCIAWLKEGEEIPEDENRIELVKESAPMVHDMCVVRVCYPFYAEVGAEMWFLYLPGLSYWNGWEEFPEEISESVLVKGRFDEVLKSTDTYGWIRIKVLETVKLPDIISAFSEVHYDENVAWSMAMYEERVCYGNWQLYSWNAQSDVGEWCLIYVDEKGQNHLVLYNNWAMCRTNTYCGNIVVPKEIMDEFKGS